MNQVKSEEYQTFEVDSSLPISIIQPIESLPIHQLQFQPDYLQRSQSLQLQLQPLQLQLDLLNLQLIPTQPQ